MSKKSLAREQIERTVSASLFQLAGMEPEQSSSLIAWIVRDMFDSDNWEAIQKYLEERVEDELPDRP